MQYDLRTGFFFPSSEIPAISSLSLLSLVRHAELR